MEGILYNHVQMSRRLKKKISWLQGQQDSAIIYSRVAVIIFLSMEKPVFTLSYQSQAVLHLLYPAQEQGCKSKSDISNLPITTYVQ